MPTTINIIHPSRDERRRLADMMSGEAAEVRLFATAQAFLRALAPDGQGCVIAPSDLPGPGTRALIEALGENAPPMWVVVLGHDSDLATAVELVRAGATDYLAPPLSRRRLLAIVRRAIAPHPA